MHAFFKSLSLIFTAEISDKSQLLVLAMATKYPLIPLILGIFASIVVSQLFATTLGILIGEALPLNLINLLAGALFIFFGIRSILSSEEKEEEANVNDCPVNPFWRVFTMYTLCELGDKTQIITLVLASQNNSFLATFVGAVFAMILANILSLLLGHFASSKLSDKAIQIVSSVLYIGFGLFSIFSIIKR